MRPRPLVTLCIAVVLTALFDATAETAPPVIGSFVGPMDGQLESFLDGVQTEFVAYAAQNMVVTLEADHSATLALFGEGVPGKWKRKHGRQTARFDAALRAQLEQAVPAAKFTNVKQRLDRIQLFHTTAYCNLLRSFVRKENGTRLTSTLNGIWNGLAF